MRGGGRGSVRLRFGEQAEPKDKRKYDCDEIKREEKSVWQEIVLSARPNPDYSVEIITSRGVRKLDEFWKGRNYSAVIRTSKIRKNRVSLLSCRVVRYKCRSMFDGRLRTCSRT